MTLALAMTAPDFALTGTDGAVHSLETYASSPLLALVQSCNHCPYVQAWEGRMNALQAEYGSRGFRLVAINANDAETHPGDSFEEMIARSRAQGFTYDYLHDPTQDLARALGSKRTPEVFLFDADRRLAYHGAVDDSRDDTAVTQHYFRDAIEALLDGRVPAVADTPAVGCTVKWKSA